MDYNQKEPLFKKGEYVHYSGWGLAKVTKVEPYHDALAGDTFRYRINTKTYKGQKFEFGVQKAHASELRPVDNKTAKEIIAQREMHLRSE